MLAIWRISLALPLVPMGMPTNNDFNFPLPNISSVLLNISSGVLLFILLLATPLGIVVIGDERSVAVGDDDDVIDFVEFIIILEATGLTEVIMLSLSWGLGCKMTGNEAMEDIVIETGMVEVEEDGGLGLMGTNLEVVPLEIKGLVLLNEASEAVGVRAKSKNDDDDEVATPGVRVGKGPSLVACLVVVVVRMYSDEGMVYFEDA